MTSRSRTNRGLTKREAYCEALPDRLIDACREETFSGEDAESRKNVHDNVKGLARLGMGSYRKWLMKYGREWVLTSFGFDFASPEELDISLRVRGY